MADGNPVCQCQCQCQCQSQKGHIQKADKRNSKVAQVWWDFLHETTFHGCKNIEDRRRHLVYRVLWTLMVLGMLTGLLYTLFQSYVSYYEYRVSSKSRIDVFREMPFPAITVCSAASINTARKNMSRTIVDYFARLTLLAGLVPPLNWSNPDTDELEQTTIEDVFDDYTFSDVITFITYNQWSGSGNMTFKPVNTNIGKCFVANNDSVHLAKSTVEGRAGGLQLMLNIQEEGVIMQNDMTSGAIIFVHDPKEDARTMDSGVMVAPGNSFYINLKPIKYKFMPAPYKSYGNTYCVDTDESYSYEVCVSDWSNTMTATYCNCTSVIGPPELLDRLPRCSLRQLSECFFEKYVFFLRETLKEDFHECHKPCSFTRYETSMSFSKFPSAAAAENMINFAKLHGYPNADMDFVRRNILKVTIYFDRFFMEHVVYEPEVTINGILSSLGGQMGFFLGASLVTVVELGETLLMLCWSLVKMCTGTGNKTRLISPSK